MRILWRVLLWVGVLLSDGLAEAIVVDSSCSLEVLPRSRVYLESYQRPQDGAIPTVGYRPYHHRYINLGTSQKSAWVAFELSNPTDHSITKLLVLSSAVLESITLYPEGAVPQTQSLFASTGRTTLFPYYTLTLAPHTTQHYTLHTTSRYNPIDFSITLQNPAWFITHDTQQQLIHVLLMGSVLALMLYSFLLSFYTQDRSYRYYSFYLFFLIYQQATYLGLTQIYLPSFWVALDIQISVIKVNALIITSSLFAIHFLKTQQRPRLHKTYWGFILLALIEMPLFSWWDRYGLGVVIFTGTLFILFNLYAGVVTFLRGSRQARLFVVGYSIVFFSYLLIILNAIGVSSLMQEFQNILMFGTAFEALILSLAFADRYIILQQDKARIESNILTSTQAQSRLIEAEVKAKTKALQQTLKTKELLLQEVHHRVKNNLQMILSIIRLQSNKLQQPETIEHFKQLENRINAIAQTYSMLLIKENLEAINMAEYVQRLLLDIKKSMGQVEIPIQLHTMIEATIPLRESVYVGLIINELVTNAYKYAFGTSGGSIGITLTQEHQSYQLSIEDNGAGFDSDTQRSKLGLKLVEALVYDQLGGEMSCDTSHHTQYTIRFTL